MFIFISSLSQAQIGGRGIYKFMDLPASAKQSALGGILITTRDYDVNNGYQNPALLNKEMHNHFAFNTMNYFNDIRFGYIGYGRHYDNVGTFSAGIQSINYGNFIETDESGKETGNTFKAGEYALNLGYGRNYLPNLSIGTNLRIITSNLGDYSSVGLAADLGLCYFDTAKNLSIGFVIKNLGTQLSTYRPGNTENLATDIQLAISKRLKYAPLRYTITLHDLQRFDLSYTDPNDPNREIDLQTGQPIVKEINIADKLARHLIVGAELLFSKNFNVRLGYDHQKRKELALSSKGSTVGFSFGFGIKIKKIDFSYASAKYHLAGSTNHFSIAANLSNFNKKKKAMLN